MNVHGFDDLNHPNSGNNLNRNNNNQPADQYNQWGYTTENLRAVEQHKVLFLSGNTKIKHPRQENYWDMLKFTWCPVFDFFSITFLILIAQLVMFIVSAAMGLNKQGQLLQIQAQTLLDLGANYSPYVKQGQVYRLVAPQFLHVNFMHLVGNFFTTLIFVTRIQYTFKWYNTIIIYILSGIGGNIFSDLVKPSDILVKAGASTSLYGIIGAILGYLILNWSGLRSIGKLLKCQLIFISLIIILFIFVLTPYNESIDYFGHLGGFLIGLTVCSIKPTILDGKKQRIMRVIFFALFIAMYLIWFLLFYLRK